MSSNWQVTWNPKLYNYQKLIQDYHSGKVQTIYQSQGMGKMIYIPQINDLVYISCEKKKIIKCQVLSIFKRGIEQKQDEYNLTTDRKHTHNYKYLEMKIIEVYEKPEPMLGFQRTWKQLK